MTQSVCILGVTGSIGQSTLKVLARHPDQYSVYAVSAYSRLDELVEICKKYSPKIVVVPKIKALELEQRLNQENLKNIEILTKCTEKLQQRIQKSFFYLLKLFLKATKKTN